MSDPAPTSFNPVNEEAPDVETSHLARKRKEHPEAGGSGVAVDMDAPSPKRVTSKTFANAPAPTTVKAWMASIPAEDRRHELFENYTSTQEKRRFKRESFDDFVDQLMDEVTLVCPSLLLLLICYLFRFLCSYPFFMLSGQRPDQQDGYYSQKLEGQSR